MDKEVNYEKIRSWALTFQRQNEARLNELTALKKTGQIYDEAEFKEVTLDSLMSVEEIIEKFIQVAKIKDSSEITEDEFRLTYRKFGITSEKGIQFVFEDRENEYFSYYKIDKTNPGLVFIVRQIVLDEFEVNRVRRDLALIDTPLYKDKNKDKEEVQKKLLESIDRINKRIYEFTKFLKAERETAIQNELEVSQAQENLLELNLNDIRSAYDFKNVFSQADSLKEERANQILEEDLDLDECN